MADTIKSVLFVDYDSLYRSLRNSDADASDRLAVRAGAWVAALEQGRLAPLSDAAGRRRILMRRCYANPALLGDRRKHFTGSGFLVVDCPPFEGRDRNAADIQMTLDTIDALEHPTGYDEFILLSAESDFSPVLIRLRAHNRHAVVYATPDTTATYRAIADGTVDEEPFVALLTSADEPQIAEPVVTRAAAPASSQVEVPTADRSEIETLARKVHAATNVPLFSPKSYLELFRALAAEIAENGYHFQATAENVAAKLTASGRNATRRQIVFIVKGLALKGHVFSNTDAPERLAEVFREQVLYLIRNAGLEMTPRELAILPAWIVGRAGPATVVSEIEPETAPPVAKPKEEAATAQPAEGRASFKPADDQAARAAKKKLGKPGPPGKSEPLVTPPPRPAPFAAKAPDAPKPSTPPRPVVSPRATTPTSAQKPAFPAAKPTTGTAGAFPRPAPISGGGSPLSRPSPLPAKPVTKPIAEKPSADRPAVDKQAAAKPAPGQDKDAVESTILAAIAQAVDVLVEDSSAAKTMEKESESAAESSAATPPAPASDVPPPEGDDIGDEIQRIIATYNRDRQQSE